MVWALVQGKKSPTQTTGVYNVIKANLCLARLSFICLYIITVVLGKLCTNSDKLEATIDGGTGLW